MLETLKYNIRIKRGSSYQLSITFKDRSGNLIDLTGCTATARFRRSLQDVAPITFTTAFTVPRSSGEFTLSLSTAQTQSLPIGSGIWDVVVAFPDGLTWSPLEGAAIVTGGATNA